MCLLLFRTSFRRHNALKSIDLKEEAASMHGAWNSNLVYTRQAAVDYKTEEDINNTQKEARHGMCITRRVVQII